MTYRVRETPPPYSSALVEWYDRGHRDLPWRATSDPWSILISEVMLQQTRVEVVIPYYLRFLERFPDYATMAQAPLDDVVALWSGLGYYRRARSLHACAVELQRRGGFPESLTDLPGIGNYTAAALASIAWGRPAVALDGNALRVYSRLFAIEEDIQSTATARYLTRRLLPAVPPGRAGDYTQAIMELGATVCLPRNPRCPLCPLAPGCQARQLGRIQDFPVLRRSTRKEFLELEALVLVQPGQVWLTRGHSLPFLKDTWLPWIGQAQGQMMGFIKHGVTFRDIVVQVYRLESSEAPPHGRWIAWGDLLHFAIPSLTRKILKMASPGELPPVPKSRA